MIYTVTLNPAWDLRLFTDETDKILRRQGEAGGKGINVARVLTALGIDCCAVSWVAGKTGQKLLSHLDQEGVSHRLFDGCGETRTNLKRIRQLTGETMEENAIGSCQSKALLTRMLAWLIEVVEPGDVVTLNGSLAFGFPHSTYFDAIKSLKQVGAITILDSSEAALAHGMMASPTMATPNYEEFCSWQHATYKDEKSFLTAVLAASVDYGSTILVTRGAKETVMAYKGNVYAAYPETVKVVQTCGAGDALLAGLVAGYFRGVDATTFFRLGVAVSSHFVAGEQVNEKWLLPSFIESVPSRTITGDFLRQIDR